MCSRQKWTNASHLAFKWLSEEKLKLKKIKGIKHEKLEMQLYLSNPLVSIQTSKFLFHLRSKMVFVRANFRHMYKDEICQLCCQLPGQQSVDTQEHLLSCSKLNIDTEVGKVGLDYENIFSSNLENQARITLLLESKFEKRKKLESEEKWTIGWQTCLSPGEPWAWFCQVLCSALHWRYVQFIVQYYSV